MKLNPIWLKTFMILSETKNFTKAAQRLYMTQPGVSQHIYKLELQLGVKLFYRDNKKVLLTEQGTRLYEYTLMSIETESRFLSTIADDSPYEGECLIGCSGTLALLVYPCLVELQLKNPKLIIRLEAAPNAKINQDILENKIDFGIVTHQEISGLIDYQEIFQFELQLMMSNEFRDQSVSFELLNTIGFIDHPDGKYYLKQVLESNALFETNVQHEALLSHRLTQKGYINQVSQILLPVAKGVGFTVMPASLLKVDPAREFIYTPPVKNPVKETYFLAKRINRSFAARHKTVFEIMMSHILKFQ